MVHHVTCLHAHMTVLYLYAMYVAMLLFSVLTGSHVKTIGHGLILKNFSPRMSMQKYPEPWSTQVNIKPSYPYK